jgi:two-component system LytT family response regulator
MRCVVVDDEPLAVKLLTDYISKTPGLEVSFQTTNVLDALQFVQEGKADLIFLDIQMPELSGIQFMKIIRNNYKVILTTAYHEYALESYEHDVVDYLLKPITFERFMTAVQKARQRIGEKTTSEDHIFIKTEYRIQKINLSSILYIEALRDYIAFHTGEGKVLSLESMRNMETILPSNRFIRIHKSYMINKEKIDFLERGKVVINNQYLPIGDTYREKLTAQLKII